MEATPHTPSDPSDPSDERLPRPQDPGVRSRLALMFPVAVVVGITATVVAGVIGRLDSALFFVGVPVLLALVVGLVPAVTTSGLLFQVITVVLLLISAFLHEGALCVLIVSPLVYGMAFFVRGLMKLASTLQKRLAVVPLLALAALEGVVPGTRILPTQESTGERTADLDCSAFVAGLENPTFSSEDRGILLRLAQYPTPTAAEGAGLTVGDTWTLAMPAGGITTRVADRTGDATRGSIDFDVVEDSARTTRWVSLQDATLSWAQTDQGCRTSVALRYVRDLDPAAYFGPVTDLFMSAGARAFLTGLG